MNILMLKTCVIGIGLIGVIDKVVDVDKTVAKGLIASGAAKETNAEADEVIYTQAQIITAIDNLDPEDESLWTKDGVPKVPSIEAELGGDITAAQRDEAWAEYLV